jgi:hypothetical protein
MKASINTNLRISKSLEVFKNNLVLAGVSDFQTFGTKVLDNISLRREVVGNVLSSTLKAEKVGVDDAVKLFHENLMCENIPFEKPYKHENLYFQFGVKSHLPNGIEAVVSVMCIFHGLECCVHLVVVKALDEHLDGLNRVLGNLRFGVQQLTSTYKGNMIKVSKVSCCDATSSCTIMLLTSVRS